MDAIVTPVIKMFIEYLAEKVAPEHILAFELPEEQQERAKELLERNSEGSISIIERMELEQMLYFDRVVTSLKARAMAKLHHR